MTLKKDKLYNNIIYSLNKKETREGKFVTTNMIAEQVIKEKKKIQEKKNKKLKDKQKTKERNHDRNTNSLYFSSKNFEDFKSELVEELNESIRKQELWHQKQDKYANETNVVNYQIENNVYDVQCKCIPCHPHNRNNLSDSDDSFDGHTQQYDDDDSSSDDDCHCSVYNCNDRQYDSDSSEYD